MRHLLLGSALVFGGAASAQTVDVQSGDHPDFTRLVLTIPQGTDWQVNATPLGYQATLTGGIDGFDLENAFDIISRNRIQALQSSDDTLAIEVACDCHVNAFLFRPEYLVIDIVDGPAPDGSLFEAPLEQAAAQPEDIPAELATEETLPATRTIAAALPILSPSQTNTSLVPGLPFSEQPSVERDANLVAAERAIIESFARAATQGVFDFPALPVAPPPEDGEEAAPIAPIAPVTDPMDGVAVPFEEADPASPGFILRTGIDREAMDGEDTSLSSCPEGVELDMSNWGEPGGFSTLIPELRMDVINEAGNRDPGASRDLARAYIYYGFGVEAREALSQITEPDENDQFLIQLSYIVDNEPVAVADLLDYRNCGPTMEAWMALASGRIDPNDERISSAVLVAHRGFPDALRGHLGIRLSQAFAAAGMLHTASELLAFSSGLVTADDSDAALAEAELVGALDGPEAELALLDDILETDPRAAPDTMVRMLDLSRETESQVDETMLEIADTMRFESNGTEATADLVEAEIRVLIQQAQPFEALALLDGDIGPMTSEASEDLRTEIVTAVSDDATDADFLNFAFSPLPAPIRPEATNAVARRLIDMGFPDEASQMLAGAAEGDAALERIALRAQAALAQSDYVSFDPGQTPPDTRSEDGGEDLETAWRAGSWEALADSDDELLSQAGQALLTQTEPLGGDLPLAERQQLLEDAQAARSLANDLLDRFVIDPEFAEN